MKTYIKTSAIIILLILILEAYVEFFKPLEYNLPNWLNFVELVIILNSLVLLVVLARRIKL